MKRVEGLVFKALHLIACQSEWSYLGSSGYSLLDVLCEQIH